jgi:hypothetical protein
LKGQGFDQADLFSTQHGTKTMDIVIKKTSREGAGKVCRGCEKDQLSSR